MDRLAGDAIRGRESGRARIRLVAGPVVAGRGSGAAHDSSAVSLRRGRRANGESSAVYPRGPAAANRRSGTTPRDNGVDGQPAHAPRGLHRADVVRRRSSPSGPADRGGPLRLGVDHALMASGLAKSLQHAFGANTGIPVLLVPGPAAAVLEAIKNGEVDAALLDSAGRPRPTSSGRASSTTGGRSPQGEFIVVGPMPAPVRGRRPPPPRPQRRRGARPHPRSGRPPTRPASSSSRPATARASHIAEQALWRAARIAPAAPWYVTADARRSR